MTAEYSTIRQGYAPREEWMMKRLTVKIEKVMLPLLFLAIACTMISVCRAAENEDARLFSFGVVADVQYGNKETSGARHYRESLGNLEECVAELNQHDLAFTIELGDFIDGNETPEKTLSDLEAVLRVYSRLGMAKFYVVGNHCLTAGKEVLHEELGLNSFYYDFTVAEAEGFRFVVLDGNGAGYGVLGEEQLEWLESRLGHACENGERVIMFSHFALLEAAARHHRMKAPEPVLDLMDEAGCLVAYFAGHDHAGGYAERNAVHHVTVKGMVEAPVNNAYAVIDVYPDRLVEVGYGEEPSRELVLKVPQPAGE
jgi:UDP-2,3-diacylglucosamine pyrophosphatase LpxH